MLKVSKHTDLSETLQLSECHDGFWLYDDSRGMNLSMRAKSEQEAFVEALTYYQERLRETESELKTIKHLTNAFVESINNL